ncbi:MAG TPA: hypothetical protein VGP36_21975 [Mycobacteriales bacterium]|jgi:hypothetical protein|nr:hypothetical protein [Mycobacteriales bacterium]
MLRLRPYEDGDRGGIDALVDASTPPLYVWKQHSLHGPDRDGARWLAARGVRVAAFDGHLTDPHLDPVTRTFPPGIPTDPLYVGRLG